MTDKLATIKNREIANPGFINDSIRDFAAMANKSVLSAFRNNLLAIAESNDPLAEELCEIASQVNDCIKYANAAWIEYPMGIIDDKNITMRFYLSISADPDYHINIYMPDETHIPQITQHIDALHNIAQAYWATFMQSQPEMMARIDKLVPNMNWADFRPDEVTHSTWYWPQVSAHVQSGEPISRVALLIFVVDDSGNPL